MPSAYQSPVVMRLFLAGVMVVIAYAGYYCSTQKNPITGEVQHLKLTTAQEVRLGIEAAPQMIAQMRGEITSGAEAQMVREVGARLVSSISPNPYDFKFHLLADNKTVNAFALPGGQVFITYALYQRLQTEAQLAGVLGHEIGHVVHRHGAEHMASAEFYQQLSNAATVGTNSYSAGQLAQYASNIRMLSYGREDELESDSFGLETMAKHGFDPRAQAQVMQILKDAAGSTDRAPNFLSSHPHPDDRIAAINAWLQKNYPNGVPTQLTNGRRLR
jgi:predicted Zn-dependent protease